MRVNRGVCSELGTSRLLLDLSSEIPPERRDLYPPCLYVPSTAATLPRLLLPWLMRCRKWGQPEVILALTLQSSGLWESSILVTAGPAAGTFRPVSVPPAAGISPRLLLVAPHTPRPAPARAPRPQRCRAGLGSRRPGMQVRYANEAVGGAPPGHAPCALGAARCKSVCKSGGRGSSRAAPAEGGACPAEEERCMQMRGRGLGVM